MKLAVKFICIVLVLCLSGCTVHPDLPDWTTDSSESVTPTDPPESTAPATQPPETDPPRIWQPQPEKEAFVRICDYIPNVVVELPYATQHNFTGQRIYDFTEPWLRYGTVQKLIMVQQELAEKDLYIKIWDGFRPVSAQFKLWEACPDPTYVANPIYGYSSHSRGNTVDITLVDSRGREITMPTGFDDFSARADRDYSDCSQEAAENARLLEKTMVKYGFKPYFGEWWHFSDEESYPVEEGFQPVAQARYYADCEEFINLRTAPSFYAEAITQIPVGEEFAVLAWDGEFAYADYQGLQGYVLGSYIRPVENER